MHELPRTTLNELSGWPGLILLFGAFVVGAWLVRREQQQARRLADRSRELERLSSELLRVNQMKSHFLANVSHELRTPLNAIVGFVEMLRDGVYGELAPRQTKPVERIAASAGHLRHLVDQILDLARIAAGRLDLHYETIELRPFLLDLVSEVEHLATGKGLSLSLDFGSPVRRIRTDELHLRQILMNLLGNAIKYTNTGSILLRVRMDRAASDTATGLPGTDRLALDVIDSGIGIDPRDHGRIFEEFEQINSGSRGDSVSRGTGLGLPISRRLAHALEGSIELRSQAGQGSIFTLLLPLPVSSASPLEESLELVQNSTTLDR